jgi:hypothetical protein
MTPVLPTDPDDGIETARVRNVKLLPPHGPGGLMVEGPADQPAVTAPGLSRSWFARLDPLLKGFSIVEATISFHYHAVHGRPSRVLHLELGKNGSSNLKVFKKHDRASIEKHLILWGLPE